MDLSLAYEQPAKTPSIEVKGVKDVEMTNANNPKATISFVARLGAVGQPADPSSKLRKGAFLGFFIMHDGILDFTMYNKALLSQWAPNINLMVRVENANLALMNAYQVQRRVSICPVQIRMNSTTDIKFFATDLAFCTA